MEICSVILSLVCRKKFTVHFFGVLWYFISFRHFPRSCQNFSSMMNSSVCLRGVMYFFLAGVRETRDKSFLQLYPLSAVDASRKNDNDLEMIYEIFNRISC